MNRNKVPLILILIFIINSVVAMPALNKVDSVTQPDGSVVSIVHKGDEWQNWIETTEGYTIQQSEVDRYWYYVEQQVGAPITLSTTIANNKTIPLNLKKNITPRAKSRPRRAAAKGTNALKSISTESYGNYSGAVLFILAEFSNRSGQTTESSWASILNNQVSDYYAKASYSKVALQAATESFGTANNGIIGWINLGYRHPNPDSNDGDTAQKMTYDAIVAANPYIDFSRYDSNNDGYVDTHELAIVVVVAGYEQAYGGSISPGVWAHQYSLQTAPTVDGVKVGEYHRNAGGYARFGELHNDHQATMGIIVHELGHLIFGLPDLYDTDQSSDGIGSFGVMGGGSWGKQSSDTWAGETPVLPTAWVQVNRGWVTATEGSGTVSITASGDSSATASNSVFKASTANNSEYFLVQNRQNIGYDRGLEEALGRNFTGGLNIFHIDETQLDNSNDQNRWVDVETADGVALKGSAESNRNLWYSGNATIFNENSSPNSRLYNRSQSGVDINAISTTGTIMSANFGSATTTITDDPETDPQVTVATLLSPSSEILDTTPTYQWNAVSGATWYYLYVKDSTGDKITQWYTVEETACAEASQTCSITPNIALTIGAVEWQIRTWNDAGDVGWSTVENFSISTENTVPATATLVTPLGDINDNTPTYRWNAVASSTWYYLYVSDSAGNGKITQWYTAEDAACTDALGTCSITPNTELALGDATWWIKTWNQQGEGEWSTAAEFNVNSRSQVPVAATLVSPSGNINDRTPTYTWNAVADATWYYLWADDSKGNRISTWYRAEEVGCATGRGTCSITPTTRLALGVGQWWIQTWSEAGNGPWSTVSNFTVNQETTTTKSVPAATRLISPSGRTMDHTPTYTWHAVSGATWYYLWVDDRSGNRINTWYTAEELGCATGNGRCSITPPTQLVNGSAQWWVRTWNTLGNGPWSLARNFRLR